MSFQDPTTTAWLPAPSELQKVYVLAYYSRDWLGQDNDHGVCDVCRLKDQAKGIGED